MSRSADIKRKTNETDIRLTLSLDGTGKGNIRTGIGFFDHMLTLFAGHGGFDLLLECDGDLHVDVHHSVEDVGIVLGGAIKEALGGREGIRRYGYAVIPMDEALAEVALDLSNRPYLHFDVPFQSRQIGTMDTEMFEEFFRAVCVHGGITLHAILRHGKNDHHRIEAVFKAFGRALKQAASIDPDVKGVPSTKGVL